MRYLVYSLLFMIAFAGSGPSPAQAAQEVTVAAASDLNFVFKEITALFEKKTGIHVKLSLGSSGNFFSQIQNGAPYDLYFSADSRYPQKLVESGHAVASSLYTYAVGRIVLWVPAQSPIQIEQRGLDVLLDPAVKKIAIANPKHAPYGRAAVAAMEQARVYDRVKDKLVLGENVSQAAQFVESGAADIGIIALSLAMAPPMKMTGRYWDIPSEAHPPLVQGAALLTGASHPVEAQSFLSFLQSAEGQAIMTRYGFVVPDKR
ncbi:MAG: Molybdate transporter, periplasmic binding protein [Nitrospirota bacterium]